MARSILALLLIARVAAAADHPIAGDKIILKDPPANSARRTFKFKATKDFAIDPSLAGDPRSLGATLEVVGRGAGDGTSGIVPLAAGNWEGLGQPPGVKGYKWLDAAFPNGVRKVFFKPSPKGGLLTVAGKGAAWAYVLAQPQVGPIDVRFTIGADVWCASFPSSTFQQNDTGKLRAALATPPADCGVPPPSACGDGTLDSGEECDDGGTANGDGCSSTCELEATNPALCAGVPSVTGTGLDSVIVATGIDRPTAIAAPRLDPSRLFVTEQDGHVRIIKNGTLLPGDFLDIHTKTVTVCPYDERGLLGLAFDPDYETNGRFYVNYTNTSGNTVISRFTVSGDPKTSDVADPTETVLRGPITQPFTNHNGGQLQFGPDGLLYVGMGDGGSACDPGGRAQDDTTLLGKLLRFDPDAPAPANPLDDIWAKGLRNPWRFSFDRANGNLYIADVGQGQREEVDVQQWPVAAGLNYGWDFYEGDMCSNDLSCPGTFCPATTTGFTMPLLVFDHSQGCSITGGYVYRGCAGSNLHGRYFYSDYCAAFLESFVYSGGAATSPVDYTGDIDPLSSVTTFGEDARGEIYVATQGTCTGANGVIRRLVPTP